MVLPADGHVHSEWSWDAPLGSMERTCARAVELGLSTLAFTEHVDATPWDVEDGELDGFHHLLSYVEGGTLNPPAFDLDGYLASVGRCRDLYPDLHIITGAEIGEPHRHVDLVARVLGSGELDRLLGSLHCLPDQRRFLEMDGLFRRYAPADVFRDYLAEIPRMIRSCDAFAVLAHIDYPVRYWPAAAGPFDPYAFQEEFRHTLRALAESGRALEVNTRVPLHPEVVRWWREEGGEAVTFGSDAHEPLLLADGFAEATAMVEAHGFRPGRDPYDFWSRTVRA